MFGEEAIQVKLEGKYVLREREGLWNSRQTPFDIFDNGLKAVIMLLLNPSEQI
jgi:hypothetical protein